MFVDLITWLLSTQTEGEATGRAGEGGECGGGGVGGGGGGVPVQQEPPVTHRSSITILQSRVNFLIHSKNNIRIIIANMFSNMFAFPPARMRSDDIFLAESLAVLQYEVPLPPGGAGSERGVRDEALGAGGHYRGGHQERSPFLHLSLPAQFTG